MDSRDRVVGALDAMEHAYAQALRAVVAPGARVLDLGGGFGRNAVVAVRCGADRVYSVQATAARPAAERVAAANGCGARIHWVEDLEGVHDDIDVVVAHMPGDPPLVGVSALSFPTVRAALERGAVPIPRLEKLSVAVTEAAEPYHRHAGVWNVGRGLDLSAARRASLNRWSPHRLSSSQLLVVPRQWATADYRSGMTTVAGSAEWVMERPALAHGLAIWSEVTFADEVFLDTRPTNDAGCRQAFFPWPEPVALVPGDRIAVSVRADGLGAANVWTWTSLVERGGTEVATFRQSTFFADPRLPK